VAKQHTDDSDALIDFYKEGSLPDLAALLIAHRFDDEGRCVSCSTHGNRAVSSGSSDYRTILRFSPDGQVVDSR
jgi:hypothetical protein